MQARSQKLQLGGSFVQNCGQSTGPFSKIMDLFNKIVDILTNLWFFHLFDKLVVFPNKLVDHFGKIVDLLFERGVLPHLENPLAMGLLCIEVICSAFCTQVHISFLVTSSYNALYIYDY